MRAHGGEPVGWLPVIAFGAAAVAAYFVTPAVTSLSMRFRRMRRGSVRSQSAHGVPRLGGVALAVGLLVGALAYSLAFGWDELQSIGRKTEFLLLLGPAGLVFLIGVVDDVRGLGAVPRILGEIVAASFLIHANYTIDSITLLGSDPIALGPFAIPLTLLWFVGITNAFNLVDGLDGLMSTLGIVALATCAALAFVGGAMGTGIFALALAGSLAGFLPWNWPRPRIFPGDSGSLLVGFVVAALAVKVSRDPAGATNPHILLAPCAIPVAETFLTIARRYVNRRPLFSGDTHHMHHLLVKSGLTSGQTLALLGGAAVIFAGTGVLALFPEDVWVRVLIPVLLIFSVLGLRRLHYVEIRVLLDRIPQILVRRPGSGLTSRVRAARAGDCLQGAKTVAELRDNLRSAVVEGRYSFLALEFSETTARRLGVQESVEECRNAAAWEYVATLRRQPRWVFSTEAAEPTGEPPDRGGTTITILLPLPPSNVGYGRLVCHVICSANSPVPQFHVLTEYLAHPLAQTLEELMSSSASGDTARTAAAADVGADLLGTASRLEGVP